MGNNTNPVNQYIKRGRSWYLLQFNLPDGGEHE